jgi:hypothetical protein
MLQRRLNLTGLIDECTLSLDRLYSTESGRHAFLSRLKSFADSDRVIPKIVWLADDKVHYESESFIPTRLDPSKPNLFLIVGNPAPDSVARRALYAYEGNGQRQHRFWRVLHATGVLRFSLLDPNSYSPHSKMRLLYAGEYISAFNVHIVPFFSLASPAGGQWSGVAGIQRLFARRFFDVVAAELAVLTELLDARAQQGDCVLVLQKDAYSALKPVEAPTYDVTQLRRQPIVSHYKVPGVDLICLPPTRLLYSRVTQEALRSLTRSVANRRTPCTS